MYSMLFLRISTEYTVAVNMNRQRAEICYGPPLTVILQYCDVSGNGVQQHSRHWGGSLEGHVKAFVSFHYVVVKYPNLDKLHWLKCAELHRRNRGGEVNTTWEVFKIVGRLARGIDIISTLAVTL